jgi:hypothetical protein
MAGDGSSWIMMLVGAALTTWLILSFTAHLRDNAGPALEEMHREVQAGTELRMVEAAQESVQKAMEARPFDPAQARDALARARRAVANAQEVMPQAPPELRNRLEKAVQALRRDSAALSERLQSMTGEEGAPEGS